jgi:hypothetical protein
MPALLVLAQCNPFAGKPPCHFLPLADGNYWKYNYWDTSEGTGTARLEVVGHDGDIWHLRLTHELAGGNRQDDIYVKNHNKVLTRDVCGEYLRVAWNDMKFGDPVEALLIYGTYVNRGTTKCIGTYTANVPAGSFTVTGVENEYFLSDGVTSVARDGHDYFSLDVGLVCSYRETVVSTPYGGAWSQRKYDLVEYHLED